MASAVGSDIWEWSPTNLEPCTVEARDHIAVAVPPEVLSLLGASGRPVIVVPKSAIVKA